MIDVQLPQSRSLKDKRMVVRHLIESARTRFGVTASEVGDNDKRQRSQIGFVAISSSADHVKAVLDAVERYVESHPELVVLSAARQWLDVSDL
jgi:uncharacterized protein YlxP (DUF503 family)